MVSIAKRVVRAYFAETKCVTERHEILATLVLVVLLLVSCGALNNASTTSTSKFAGQRVTIVGSTALLPLAARAADLFQQRYPGVKIDVQGGGSSVGLSAVNNNQANIGDSDIYADPSQYSNPNLTDHIVCITPMTLIVNPDVSITSLSTQQVINIYAGVAKNWQEVGGPNLPIVSFVKPSASGTRSLFDKYVLGTTAESGQSVADDTSTVVVDTVAHTPGAIGYTAVSTLNSTVQVVKLDGFSATEQSIQASQYRFWGFEHMYTLDNGIDATTAYLDFMQTSQIQQLAVNLGYVSASAGSASSAQR